MAENWDDDDYSGESGVPSPTEYDDEFDDDFDDDFDGKKGGLLGKLQEKKKLLMTVGGGLVSLGLLGWGSWYFLENVGKNQSGAGVSGAVSLALNQQSAKGLTPARPFGQGTASNPRLTPNATNGTVPPVAAASSIAASDLTAEGDGPDILSQQENTPPAVAAKGMGIAIPAVLDQAFDHLGPAKQSQPLPPPNDAGLFEDSVVGKLPRISPQGKEAWQTYARPFTIEAGSVNIGLVVTGLGLSKSLTEAALKHLPSTVSLAFSPYAGELNSWINQARAMGHEVLIELPLESDSFPADDPGPLAMMTSKTPRENTQILKKMMAQSQAYIGFVGQHGSRFTKNRKAMAPILAELKGRGLFFMDPRTTEQSVTLSMADKMQLPRAIADVTINSMNDPNAIRAQLDALTLSAGAKGFTAALMPVTPSGITAIKQWAGDLGPVSLAPVSSIAGRQPS